MDAEMFAMLMSVAGPGSLEEMVDSVKPTPAQYAMAVGGKALLIPALGVDFDVTEVDTMNVLEILEPEEHKAEFPDYEYRLQNSYVLCRWYFGKDIELTETGWFGRVELMPLTVEQFEEVKTWMNGSEKPPEGGAEWIKEEFMRYSDEIADTSPGKIARPAKCDQCGGRSVDLHIQATMDIIVQAGVALTDEGMEYFTPISEKKERRGYTGHLHCEDCGHTRELDQNEFQNPASPKRKTVTVRHGRHS